jgi:hypothetical protein
VTPVGLAATAATSAVAAGLAAIAATVLGVRALHDPGAVPPEAGLAAIGFPYYMLVFGTVGGIVIAGIVAWTLLEPLGSTYRRGGLALVCAFATVILMLVCRPVDQLLGKPGLAGLIAVCLAVALLLGRRAWRVRSAGVSAIG